MSGPPRLPPVESLRRWTVTVAWVSSIALTVVGLVLLAATWDLDVPSTWGVRGFLIVLSPVAATIGAIVATRVRGNPVGWLLLAAGLLAGVQQAAEAWAEYGILAHPGTLPGAEIAAWLAGWTWIPAMGCLGAFLPLVFPDGRLRSSRWRLIAAADVLIVAVATFGGAFLPGPLDNASYVNNPLALPIGYLTSEQRSIAYYPLILTLAISVVPLALRFRQARGEARQQLKWLAWSGIVLGLTFLLIPVGQAGIFGTGGEKVVEVLTVIGLLGIPISAGLAVLRYRLWDIDRIISRTLSYALLTAVLVAIYAAGVLIVQGLVAPLAEEGGPIAVAASTLLAASLFQPLRRRIQGVVDRRFNRARYDLEREAEAFAGQVRHEVDLGRLSDEVSAVVDRTMEPATVGVWIRGTVR
jgi:hypothetical protein